MFLFLFCLENKITWAAASLTCHSDVYEIHLTSRKSRLPISMRQNFLLLCSFTLLCWDERFLLDNLCMYYPPIIISFSFILRSQLNPYPTTGQLCSQILLYRAIFIAISATKPQWEFIWILNIHCQNFMYFENITTFCDELIERII